MGKRKLPKGVALNERGFAEYGEGVCSYGIKWRVVESSIVGRPRCWIFVDGVLSGGGSVEERTQRGCLHLNGRQVRQLIAHLQRFVRDSQSPDHWKNDAEYKRVLG